MTIHVGATVERPPGPKYTAALSFAELTFPSSWPKHNTLAKWKATAPELRCALVAPRGVTHSEKGVFRFDDELEERIAWFVGALEALDADAVIPTGSDLTTSQRDRDRFAAFLERLPRRDTRHIVWAPKGLWTTELSAPFGRKLGIVCAFDPLQDEAAPTGSVGYARLKALGGRQRFSEGLLFDIVDAMAQLEYAESFVALESERSFQEASRLRQLWTE
ncbi:MAG: DUF72 domain-containing protein [Myxococcota bacterium]